MKSVLAYFLLFVAHHVSATFDNIFIETNEMNSKTSIYLTSSTTFGDLLTEVKSDCAALDQAILDTDNWVFDGTNYDAKANIEGAQQGFGNKKYGEDECPFLLAEFDTSACSTPIVFTTSSVVDLESLNKTEYTVNATGVSSITTGSGSITHTCVRTTANGEHWCPGNIAHNPGTATDTCGSFNSAFMLTAAQCGDHVTQWCCGADGETCDSSIIPTKQPTASPTLNAPAPAPGDCDMNKFNGTDPLCKRTHSTVVGAFVGTGCNVAALNDCQTTLGTECSCKECVTAYPPYQSGDPCVDNDDCGTDPTDGTTKGTCSALDNCLNKTNVVPAPPSGPTYDSLFDPPEMCWQWNNQQYYIVSETYLYLPSFGTDEERKQACEDKCTAHEPCKYYQMDLLLNLELVSVLMDVNILNMIIRHVKTQYLMENNIENVHG